MPADARLPVLGDIVRVSDDRVMATIAAERGQLAPAGAIQPGDKIVLDGRLEEVAAVQRARGRKPRVGETLYLVTSRGQVKVNSTAGIRVGRSTQP